MDLKTKLAEILGGEDRLVEYEKLKSHGEKVDFLYHSPMVQTIFKKQLQVLKKAQHESVEQGGKITALIQNCISFFHGQEK